MSYEDASEIVKMVDDRERELKDLKDRFESDYRDYWRLTAFTMPNSTSEEYDNYTTTWTRNKADKITEILGYAPRSISIPQEDDDEKEREDKAAAERLIYWAYNAADERLRATIQPTLQEQAAFYSVNRGWVIRRVYFHTDEEGNLIPDIVDWDPLNVIWEIGPNGALWICHKRPITKAQAKAEYGEDLGEKPVIYDFWDEEKYKIICNAEARIDEKHELDHIPIFIGMVGPAPFIQSGEITDTIKDMGESIYAPDRPLIPVMNKLKTYYLTIIGQGTHNPYAVYSSNGQKSLGKNPFRKGAEIQLSTDNGEKIERLFEPTMPRNAAEMVAMVQNELTMGGAISLLWGIDEAGGSGYRANLLTHAASTVYLPRQRLMENEDEWTAREILSQYKSGQFGKTRIRGRDKKGVYFDTDLAPTDIKGDWYPEVKYSPSLPFDEAARMNTIKQGREIGVYSIETAMEKAGVQDVEAEKGRNWREQADADEYIRAMKIAKELKEDGRPDLAQRYLQDFFARTKPQGNGGTPNPPSNVVPPAEYMGLTPEQQRDLNLASRLSRMGLERGR